MKLHPIFMILAVACGALCASAARADVVIDNFTDAQSLSQTGGGAVNLSNGPIAAPGAVGGARSITLGGSAFPGQSVSFSIGGGMADIQSGSLSAAVGMMLYNGGGAGLGNLLAMTNAVQLMLQQFNVGNVPSNLDVTINDGSSSVTKTISLGSSINVPTNLLFDFTGSGLNFNNINSVKVTLNSNGANGADITAGGITALTFPVPEPAAIAVWTVLGGVGLALTRRWGLVRR
jgi:hypothetical protein